MSEKHNCKKCGSNSLYEKEVPPPHKIGVYCHDCEAWYKWGHLLNKKTKEELKMSFEINHEDVFSGNGLMKEGDYEVVVNNAMETATKSGITYVSIDLIVRNDVEQQYKNKHIFHAVWKIKDTGNYNMTNFNTIGKALCIPNGTRFESFEDLLNCFIGKVAKVTVKHEEYNGKTNEKIKAWKESNVQTCNHVFKDKKTVQQSDNDLPF